MSKQATKPKSPPKPKAPSKKPYKQQSVKEQQQTMEAQVFIIGYCSLISSQDKQWGANNKIYNFLRRPECQATVLTVNPRTHRRVDAFHSWPNPGSWRIPQQIYPDFLQAYHSDWNKRDQFLTESWHPDDCKRKVFLDFDKCKTEPTAEDFKLLFDIIFRWWDESNPDTLTEEDLEVLIKYSGVKPESGYHSFHIVSPTVAATHNGMLDLCTKLGNVDWVFAQPDLAVYSDKKSFRMTNSFKDFQDKRKHQFYGRITLDGLQKVDPMDLTLEDLFSLSPAMEAKYLWTGVEDDFEDVSFLHRPPITYEVPDTQFDVAPTKPVPGRLRLHHVIDDECDEDNEDAQDQSEDDDLSGFVVPDDSDSQLNDALMEVEMPITNTTESKIVKLLQEDRLKRFNTMENLMCTLEQPGKYKVVFGHSFCLVKGDSHTNSVNHCIYVSVTGATYWCPSCNQSIQLQSIFNRQVLDSLFPAEAAAFKKANPPAKKKPTPVKRKAESQSSEEAEEESEGTGKQGPLEIMVRYLMGMLKEQMLFRPPGKIHEETPLLTPVMIEMNGKTIRTISMAETTCLIDWVGETCDSDTNAKYFSLMLKNTGMKKNACEHLLGLPPKNSYFPVCIQDRGTFSFDNGYSHMNHTTKTVDFVPYPLQKGERPTFTALRHFNLPFPCEKFDKAKNAIAIQMAAEDGSYEWMSCIPLDIPHRILKHQNWTDEQIGEFHCHAGALMVEPTKDEINKALFIFGPPQMGKSAIADFISKQRFGQANIFPFGDQTNERFGLSGTEGQHLLYAPDITPQNKIPCGTFKTIVTGEMMMTEGKNQHAKKVSGRFNLRMLVVSNHDKILKEEIEAQVERVAPYPFTVPVPEKNSSWKRLMEKEQPASIALDCLAYFFMTWSIETLHNWDWGKFICEQTKTVLKQILFSDPIVAWMQDQDNCTLSQKMVKNRTGKMVHEYYIPAKEFFEHYFKKTNIKIQYNEKKHAAMFASIGVLASSSNGARKYPRNSANCRDAKGTILFGCDIVE